jgi:hypothetical protein
VGKEWDEALRLIVKPFLIAKEEIDDQHRRANEVVIQIIFEEAELSQNHSENVDKPIHDLLLNLEH